MSPAPTALDIEAALERADDAEVFDPPPLLFVGGTGRSGTHVVAKILNNHSHYRKVPNEARFHTDPGGIPDVLAGRTGPELFVWRLRRHWYRNFEPARRSFRGLYRYVPRRRLEVASEAFLRRFEVEPEAACRQLFFDLLWPLAAEESKAGLIEQSCDVVAEAPTLARLFPELVGGERRRSYRLMRRFAGLRNEEAMLDYFQDRVRDRNAHLERWRGSVPARQQAEVDATYERMIAGLEADGVHCAPLLRRVYEERRAG
jgi:hypothetical protein